MDLSKIIFIIIIFIFLIYPACLGVVIAALRNAKVIKALINSINIKHKRKTLEGIAIVFAPISICLILIIYVAYGAYWLTQDFIKYTFDN